MRGRRPTPPAETSAGCSGSSRAHGWVGGVILRRRYRKAEDGLLIPMQIQVMEIDHLDTQRTESLATGGRIIGGVEFDPIERISAYWLFPPCTWRGGAVAKALTSVRVPAEDVIHLFEQERRALCTDCLGCRP